MSNTDEEKKLQGSLINGYAGGQEEQADHTNSGMLTMPGEQELQRLSPNGSAGGQEEEPSVSCGCIKRRLLLVWNKHKKAIIGSFILISIVAVVFFLLGRYTSLNCHHDDINCPSDWIGHQGHCYKLSEEEKSWNESRNLCILHNASLAKITKQEVDFVRKITRDHVFWIGLERHPPWKWLDGDNATSEIMGHGGEGGGDCAYLDDSGKAYPGTCTTKHRFICKKNDPKRS